MAKQVTKYESEDGQFFDTELEADKHDAHNRFRLNAANFLRAADLVYAGGNLDIDQIIEELTNSDSPFVKLILELHNG